MINIFNKNNEEQNQTANNQNCTSIKFSQKYNNCCVLESGEVIDMPMSWYNMLLVELKEWRYDMAKQIDLPPYCVFPDKTLHNILSIMPRNKNELWLVAGIAETLIDTYGTDIVNIVDRFFKSKGVIEILYGKTAFDIRNARVKSILGYLSLLENCE